MKKKKVKRDDALDKIIYGFEIMLVNERGEVIPNMFFISHKDNLTLKYVARDSKNLLKIEFSKVTQIEFGNQRGNFCKMSTKNLLKYNPDLCLTIFKDALTIDLIFYKTEDLNDFSYSIWNLWEEEREQGEKEGHKHSNLRKIWEKYDDDHSGKMDIKEFIEFVKETKINVTTLGISELFKRVDSDNSGKIDFEEFIKFLEELTSAKEFEEDFSKYAGNKGYLDISDLIKFMSEVQKEDNYEIYDAIHMILFYNKEIDDELLKRMQEKLEKLKDTLNPNLSDWSEEEIFQFKFKLSMLQNFMIHPLHNNINAIIENSMDFPTNDYFIYSSHNTYLKGHQLYGESAVEMYLYAINMGCRCVELDCWDGKNNEPKITHGMTFTSDILFKDVLKIIKENAFKKTDTPFFLSIEMHCGDEQQKVMAHYFKTILVDFWTPEMDGIPDYFPTPNQLKGKFIVKCKKPKVSRKSFAEAREERQKKYYDLNSSPAIVKHHLDIKRNLSVIKETDENDFSKKGTLNMDSEKVSFNAKTITSLRKQEDSKNKEDKNVSVMYEEKTKEEQEIIAKETLKKKKKTIKEVVSDLYEIIGLTSVNFKEGGVSGSHYQPWEVVSLSEGKILKYLKSNKAKLLELTSNSFLRVYPAGTRFDSSNFDPTKSWIVGSQLVSLNLQSLSDDYTLLNHLFFTINNKRGYILKPEYLRQGTYKNREYLLPIYTLQFDLLSGIMLQKCMKEVTTQLYITVNVIGTFEDDKNPTLKTDCVTENFLHPIFRNRSINFSIYEENLSFLYIRIIDNNNNNILARSVVPLMTLMEGYRNILLYDELCHEIENCILIVRSKKSF